MHTQLKRGHYILCVVSWMDVLGNRCHCHLACDEKNVVSRQKNLAVLTDGEKNEMATTVFGRRHGRYQIMLNILYLN